MSVITNKLYIGKKGEINFAIELHKRGWQVYAPFIDENLDFIITKYYCNHCQDYSEQESRKLSGKGQTKNKTFKTNLCGKCKKDELVIITRFLQVKTSEGVPHKTKSNQRTFSFHANLKFNIDERSYYVWIADNPDFIIDNPIYYIFNHRDINKFDDTNLDSYQKTDNQKINLHISENGFVTNKSKKRDFSYFNDEFKNNFKCLEKLCKSDPIKK